MPYNEEPGEEGAVIEQDVNALATLNKSEIDMQITTAKRYPRSVKQFRDETLQMVTLTEEIAAECIYALPRDGKVIEGPSARFAEIILSAWGNARAGARVVNEDNEFVTSQGVFYDLQRNVAINYEVQRRITDRQGRRYKSDMVAVTSNAACSIALRNAILKGIPKAFWKDMYDAARKTVAGDLRTLANRRSEAIKSFTIYGVSPEKLFQALNVQGAEDITIEHLVILKGMLTALREGDTTPEQLFSVQDGAHVRVQNATEKKADDLAAKYAKPVNPPEPPQPEATQAAEAQQSQNVESRHMRKRSERTGEEPQGERMNFD